MPPPTNADECGQMLYQAAVYNNSELMRDLLSGETVQQLEWSDNEGRTALYVAAQDGHLDCVRLLLTAGADASVRTMAAIGSQKTALHVAAANGHESVVQALIGAGADLLAVDSSGYCPLQLAQIAGQHQTANILIEAMQTRAATLQSLREDLDQACYPGDYAKAEKILKQASKLGNGFLDELLNGGSEEDYTSLYRCCERGHSELVDLLLRHGACKRVHSVTFYSPLYIALHAGYLTIVNSLLQKFPDLAAVATFEGWLPIHAACKTGDLNALELLLNFDYPEYCFEEYSDASGKHRYRFAFDVNKQDCDCRTPLYIACAEGHMNVVRALLNLRLPALDETPLLGNEDVLVKSVHVEKDDTHPAEGALGESPMHTAHCTLNTSTVHRPSASVRPVQVDVYSTSGRTPLQIACSGGHLAIVRLLVNKANADVNLPIAITDQQLADMSVNETNDGFICAGSGALIEACKRGDEQIVEFLLERSAMDHDNQALSVCLAADHVLLACRLLCTQVFADPEFRVNKKSTEVDWAVLSGGGSGRTVVPSTMYPAVPSMLNWHKAHLHLLSDDWLYAAATHLNQRLRANCNSQKGPSSLSKRSLALTAITRVDLSDNQLSTLPMSLLQLPSLRILNAAKNMISSVQVVKGERVSSVALEELHLEHNQLRTLPSELFTELCNMQSLDLSHNKVHQLPLAIWLAPKLKDLNVSFNRLKNLPSWLNDSSGAVQLLLRPASVLTGTGNELDDCQLLSADSGIVTSRGPASLGAQSTGTGGGQTLPDDNVSVVPLQRHNLWQRTVELSKICDEDEQALAASAAAAVTGIVLPSDALPRRQRSLLTSLNLANNQLQRVQECLPCLAPALTRLNLSGNLLSTMGSVCHYPPRLKHLDLSHNRVSAWFGSVRVMAGDCGQCHVYAADTNPLAAPNNTRSRSPTSRHRSQSTARVPRAASVVRSETVTNQQSEQGSVPMCIHRRHSRFDNLRTLILAHNKLDRISLHLADATPKDRGSTSSRRSTDQSKQDSSGTPVRQRLLFPCLSMLDMSANQLSSVPASVSQLSALSVFNLSHNVHLHSLPPEMGLLTKLWNLTLTGCSLDEPLRSMMQSNKFKTMDMVGYLRSVLEDAKPYARLKLMIVGIQGIGKTSLLEQLRANGSVTTKKQNNENCTFGASYESRRPRSPQQGIRKREPSLSRSFLSFTESLVSYATGNNEMDTGTESWAKRMAAKNIGNKTAKGNNISTVGVDVGDWTYEPKRSKNMISHGPITFRTWDFGGQREYYATHQYFLSRRSLYLVCWRLTDGEAGIDEIQQWLVNIQARAPGSPVIIVGTHYDEILANQKKFPPDYVDDLQQMIRERFVAVQDHDKKGLPRCVESVVVSSKTKHNTEHLCQLVYSTAYDLRLPGSKQRLLEQKIPASYLALEEIVGLLADERKSRDKDPVYGADQFMQLVQQHMLTRFGRPFRDSVELHQAVCFLHENGVMLHYADATLKDLYFVDPQWLCDVLAHVITIREINPFAKNGIMRLDDLKLLFKATRYTALNVRSYILNLLQKFELALTWDGRNLLIPSLLPDEYQLRAGYTHSSVEMAVRCHGWQVQSVTDSTRRASVVSSNMSSPSTPAKQLHFTGNLLEEVPPKEEQTQAPSQHRPLSQANQSQPPALFTLHAPGTDPGTEGAGADQPQTRPLSVRAHTSEHNSTTRVYLMSYVPSGFWSRLLTRLLGDEQLPDIIDKLFTCKNNAPAVSTAEFKAALAKHKPMWLLWQTGLEIRAFDQLLFSLKEFLSLAIVRHVNYDQVNWLVQHEDNNWRPARSEKAIQIELHIPELHLKFDWDESHVHLVTDVCARSRLLSLVVECMDTLLEDWYPALGTRFVHTSEGKWLVTRLVPCTECMKQHSRTHNLMEATVTAATLPSVTSENEDAAFVYVADQTSVAGDVYSFVIEDCILAATEARQPECPTHGSLRLSSVAPDVLFLELPSPQVITPEQIKRGKMIGRGAFGFVFKAAIRRKDRPTQFADVALKMLQPVDPGFGGRNSAAAAYKAAHTKWQRDPAQYACRAYLTARQELNVLSKLQHPHVVGLIGVCVQPLALVVVLAPLGALNALLHNYRRSGAKLHMHTLQQTAAQVAKALEYLHQQHIIYRDLKSENVLVWRYPPPFSQLTDVEIRLGDYGISRSVFPSGGAKGFGGTEGFMAPEILRYNGEEEYTEKVDCFSFAMFLYELLTLKLPFDGQDQVKELMLDGGRPQLTPMELLYPANVLDCMCVSWAQQPADRPTSSQLVSMTTAPEFTHLLDVVSLADTGASVLVGDAFVVDEPELSGQHAAEDVFEGELWLSRSDGQISVLSCIAHGWLDYKNIFVNEDSFVTAMTLVEDTMWLGELTGVVRVFCAKTYCELYRFGIAPHVLSPSSTSNKPASAPLSLPIACMVYVREHGRVLVGTEQPACVLVCAANHQSDSVPQSVLSTLCLPTRQLHTIALLTEHEMCVSVWTGLSEGFISICSLSADNNSLVQTQTVNHYEPVMDGVEVSRLISVHNDPQYVWSYVFPGSVMYQWDALNRRIVAKLDCSKIVPCSESIHTMNIDERMNAGRCQVTAVSMVSGSSGSAASLLYIGTTWGVVIVAEANHLRPVVAFRPHLEDIRVVMPLNNGKRIAGNNQSAAPTTDTSIQSRDKSHNSGQLSTGTGTESVPDSSTGTNSVDELGTFVLTVGKGYRSLLHRFMDTCREDDQVLDSRNRDTFAIMWRTDDWTLT